MIDELIRVDTAFFKEFRYDEPPNILFGAYFSRGFCITKVCKCTKVEYIVSFSGSSPRVLPEKREVYVITFFLFQPCYIAASQARLIKNLLAPLGTLKGKECV
jgi:hypothetical protein